MGEPLLCAACGEHDRQIERFCSACWEKGWSNAVRQAEANLKIAHNHVKYCQKGLAQAKEQLARATTDDRQ